MKKTSSIQKKHILIMLAVLILLFVCLYIFIGQLSENQQTATQDTQEQTQEYTEPPGSFRVRGGGGSF